MPTTSTANATYIGLMSGTSGDGVDGVLIRFSSAPNDHCAIDILAQHQQPFDDDLRQTVLGFNQPGADECRRMGETALRLNTAYLQCIDALRQSAADTIIAAIGCHGQTIRHYPQSDYPHTTQLINGGALAVQAKLPVICDFRNADIALGGQGAPLAPAFHRACFGADNNIGIINLGGIANITYLPADPKQQIIGFDTGPANCLIDEACQNRLQLNYDHNGDIAASGQVQNALLDTLLQDLYFKRPLPKSTGRDYFNSQWLNSHLSQQPIADHDLIATLSALTASSIAQAMQQLPEPIHHLYLCGGGAYNQTLQRMIAHYTQCPVSTTNAFGVAPEWVEASAFAWLAKQRLQQQTNILASVTGASRDSCGGSVYLP